MRVLLACLILSALQTGAMAQQLEWLEPEADLQPPPVETYLEEQRRAAMTPQERAEENAAERQRNVLQPVRDARELRQTLAEALTRVEGATRAYRETAAEGEDRELLDKRLAELREAERFALSHWGAGSVKTAELGRELGDDHSLVETLQSALDDLRTAQREARQTLNRAG